jgi:YtfJ family uncharacterized protein
MKASIACKTFVAGTLSALLMAGNAWAARVQVGQTLPNVTISDYGQTQLKGDDISYKTWSSQDLRGKVFTIYHIAGTQSAAELNETFMDRLVEKQFDVRPGNPHQTVTIVNLDDAIFGTSGIVRDTIEERQRKYQVASFVLDDDGKVRETWELQSDSSAIIVVDPQGKVLFFKEGALSAEETEQALQTIEQSL